LTEGRNVRRLDHDHLGTGGHPVVGGGDVAVWFGELDEPHTEGQLRVRAPDPELVWLAHEHQAVATPHRLLERGVIRRTALGALVRARCRDHGGSKPHAELLAERLHAQGVETETLFYPSDHEPPLGHEYQFDLDSEAGQFFLERLLTFLRRRLGGPAQPEPEASTTAS